MKIRVWCGIIISSKMKLAEFAFCELNVLRTLNCSEGVIQLWSEAEQFSFDVCVTVASKQFIDFIIVSKI